MTTPPEETPVPPPSQGDMLAVLAADAPPSAPTEPETSQTSPEPQPSPTETPESPPAAVPPAPPDPELERLRQSNVEYERIIAEQQQANAAAMRQQQQAQLQQQAQQYQQELQDEDGISPERAAKIATRDALLRQQLYNSQVEYQAKASTAQHYATQYGVPAESLMAMTSPDAMESEAKRQTQTNALQKQIDDLRAKVGQTIAPVQHFDGGSGASPALNNDANFIAAMGNHENPLPLNEEFIKRFKTLTGLK